MEVPEMDEVKKTENHVTSAAAFVEGGIQDACDDACSICLEAFCESDPSAVTSCKHDFHLQCILEWCQRSSNCPMCWRPISLKDPSSQELLEAVERERNIRFNPSRHSAIFRHPTLGDFELQHLPMGASDAELEERILQHLAAAAMGRAHHLARRESSRSRSSAHGRPQLMVFSTQPNAPSTVQGGSSGADETPSDLPTSQHEIAASNRSSANQLSSENHDRAGPSELQSFSDSLRSRLNSVSMRYKESISKSTRGWKEKLFSRSTSVSDLGCEVRREVNAGIASVSRMMERLETRERSRDGCASDSQNIGGSSVTEQSNQGVGASRQPSDSNTAAFGPSSTLN